MTDNSAESRRERRAARRRANILEAAAKVFAAQGFHRTTTKDIAEAADIAEGTIYNYFQSKDDLLFAILDHLANLQSRREIMEHSLHRDLREFFTEHLAQRLAMIPENRMFIAAVVPELLSSEELRKRYVDTLFKPSIEIIENHLQARKNAGQIPPIEIPVASRFLTATLLGLTMLTLLGEDVSEAMWLDMPKLTNELVTFMMEGLNALSSSNTESLSLSQGQSSETSLPQK